jgi:hypothetical protein
MGMSFSVAFNKKVAPYDKLGADHVAVGDSLERLDKVAKKHKLAMLSEFHSIDPEEAAEMFDLDPEEMGLPPLQWFNPEKGLAAVRGLITLLREDPQAIPKSSAILKDLEEIVLELLAASKQKAKFHFALLD